MKSKFFKILGVVAAVAMIVAAIVAPVAADVGGVTVTVATTNNPTYPANTINNPGNYSIYFTPTVQLLPTSTPADSFTVTFPAGFTVTGPITASINGSSGWVNNAYVSDVTSATTSAVSGQAITFTLGTGDKIGSQSQVLVNITAGVTNPGTAGSYTITVATSQEKNAITSSAFAIVNPTPTPLPGVASVYNTASTPVLINQFQSLDAALVLAESISGGATIKLSAGTYTDTTLHTPYTFTNPVTIQGTDPSAANVILKESGAWTVAGTTVVIDSVTIDGKTGVLTVTGSKSATVSNSIIQNGALTIGGTGTPVGTSNVTKDTFNVKTGATGLTPSSATTVTGSTFNLTGQAGYGINAGTNGVDITVTGSTFTGATNTTDQYLGNGINIGASPAGSSISTSTFTGLSNALTVNGGTAMVNFFGNTVTNCGQAPATGTSTAAIIVTNTAANGVNIYGNTITNGAYYIISVTTGNDANVNIYQNTFTGNAKVASGDSASTLVMARNWWGGAANVPANVKQAGTSAGYTFTPALGAASSAAAFAITTGASTSALNASATVGVSVTAVGEAGEFGATALAGNPVTATLPSADTAVKYFDVYGQLVNGNALTTGETVDFYGTTAAPVVNSATSQSQVLFYNSVTGSWVNAGGSINTYGNYVEIYIGTVTGQTSVMTNAQFNGTPFVLVTVAIPLGGVAPAATPLYPVNGSVNVPITNMTFTWPAVAGTGVTYQFAIAQASANTSANEFAILDYSDNTLTNAEPSQETLQYNTIYWWEVRAVTLNASGAVSATGPWSIQMFTTAPPPVTTTAAGSTGTTTVTSVVITQPVTTVVSTQTSVVITQTTGNSTPAIPSYLLWAVIAVGAVLIIAVIVLIVRTRRIP